MLAKAEHAAWREWTRGGNHVIRRKHGISGLREITQDREAGIPRLAESGLRGQEGSPGITVVAPHLGGNGNAKVVSIKPAWVFDVTQTDERVPCASVAA